MKANKIVPGAALAAGIVVASYFLWFRGPDATSEAKTNSYPLSTCVVTDEKLGSMGEPFIVTHEAREVQFCCKGCVKDFNKEPAKYLRKIEAAEQAGQPGQG